MTEPPRPPADPLAQLGEIAARAEARTPEIAGAQLPRTDLGNAQRIALYHQEDLRYCLEQDQWYHWSGKHWERLTQGELIGFAVSSALRIGEEAHHVGDEQRPNHQAWAAVSQSAKALGSALHVAKSQSSLWLREDDINALPTAFNVNNCTIENVRTGEWHPHRRDDALTWLCPTDWDPSATSPLLDAFLNRFLPNLEEREYVLASLAVATFTHGNPQRALMLLLGPTSTGKSTLMDLMIATLGRDYVTSVNPSVFRGTFSDAPRPDLLRALRSRLLLAFEASEHWQLHSDQIKRLTGGDPIAARAMRSDTIQEVVAPFTPVIVANEVPRVKGADHALRRRLRVLLMDAPGEYDDGRARDALVNDLEARRALLNLLLRLYREHSGRLPEPAPQRFEVATMNAFLALDDVAEVLEALVEEGTLLHVVGTPITNCITTGVMYRCYREYLKKTHGDLRDALGQKQFTQRLESLGYETARANGSRVVNWTLGGTLTASLAKL